MNALKEILDTIELVKNKPIFLSNKDVLSILKAVKTIVKDAAFIDHLIYLSSNLNDSILLVSTLLTKREEETLNQIGLGKNNSEIAKKLSIQTSTVETHRKHIKKKLNLLGSSSKFLKFAVLYNLSKPNALKKRE